MRCFTDYSPSRRVTIVHAVPLPNAQALVAHDQASKAGAGPQETSWLDDGSVKEESRLRARTSYLSLLDEFGDLGSIIGSARGGDAQTQPSLAAHDTPFEASQPMHRLEPAPSDPVDGARAPKLTDLAPPAFSPPITTTPPTGTSAARGSAQPVGLRDKLPPERKEAILRQLDASLVEPFRNGKIGQEKFRDLYRKWHNRKKRGWYARDTTFALVSAEEFKAFVQSNAGLKRADATPMQSHPSAKKQKRKM